MNKLKKIAPQNLFWRLMILLLCTCILTATLATLFYSVTGARIFAQRIADELLPRARSVARLASRYQTGQISFDSFIDFATKEQQGGNIYIFDSQGIVVAYSKNDSAEQVIEMLAPYVGAVLSNGETEISTNWRAKAGIVVGVPITDNVHRITGAIFLTKSPREVSVAMRGLVGALVMSCIIAAAVVTVPAYISSRQFSKPIRQMTDVAVAMSRGDFSRHAEVKGFSEMCQLGSALNQMSDALCANIRDLILARSRLNTILAGLSEGVLAFDSDGKATYWNPAVLRLFHCEDDAAAVEEASSFLTDACRAVLSSGETRTIRHDVGGSMLLLTLAYSQEAIEKRPGAVVLVQDVTESERLEQTRRDYVANVSHELRTPIASVRSLAEALNDGMVKSEEDRSRYYGYILRESLRLSRLINDLLELSRLQSGTVALTRERFSLRDLMLETTERLRVSASYSGIDLAYSDDPTLPDALSNRDRIEQVLIALIDNAIKYADDDGTVTVSTQVGERIAVRVANTGHIAEKDLPHLFERFYKADAAHSEGGTGLGLAIAYEVMQQLGETIEAANVGGEAVFTFSVTRFAG